MFNHHQQTYTGQYNLECHPSLNHDRNPYPFAIYLNFTFNEGEMTLSLQSVKYQSLTSYKRTIYPKHHLVTLNCKHYQTCFNFALLGDQFAITVLISKVRTAIVAMYTFLS